MKILITIICFFFTCTIMAQNTWFKFVPGGYCRNSAIQNDTIFTFCPTAKLFDGLVTQGLTVNKIGLKYGNVLISDSFFYFSNKLNDYTSLEFRSKNNTLYKPTQNNFFVALNYTDSTNYGIKLQSDLFSYPDFKPQNIPLNYDTFDTVIEGLYSLNKRNYVITRFININNSTYTFFSPRLLRIHSEDSTELIWTYDNTKDKVRVLYEMIEDKKNTSNLFLALSSEWAYKGWATCWEGVIQKIDTTGKLIWECTPSGNQDSINTEGGSFVQIPNGNLLCSWIDYYYRPWKNPKDPYTNETIKKNATIWFAEIDYLTGKRLWLKNNRQFLDWKMGINDTDFANLRMPDAKIIDNGVVWCGYRRVDRPSYQSYTSLPFLFKTDFQGNPIWYREHDLFPNDTTDKGFEPASFIQTPDKGFLLSGKYSTQWIKSQQEFNFFETAALLKLDSNGCLEPGCNVKDNIIKVLSQNSKCTIFPNPATTKLTINSETAIKEIYIYDVLGKLVKQVNLENTNTKSNEIAIDELNKGVYIIQVVDVFNAKLSSKFIKE